MATPNERVREQTRCVTNIQQYFCGCTSSRMTETRRRDCPNCREITNLARQRSFCVPGIHPMKIPTQCRKCEHTGDRGELVPANSTLRLPAQDGSTTTQQASADARIKHQPQVFCSAIATRFVCSCENRVKLKRSQTCPYCHHISQKAKQSALCRPQPVPANAERICDKCLLSMEQRLRYPPRCLSKKTTTPEDVANRNMNHLLQEDDFF